MKKMNKEKILGYVESAGLLQVVIAAAIWILPDLRTVAQGWMAVAAVMLLLGRFLQEPFYLKYSERDPKVLTLRRLYHQRVFGIIALILAAAMMFVPQGFYYGMYVGKSSWLILFVIFVVIEVYTAFRISSVDKG